MNLIDVQPVKFSFFEKPPASSMNQAFVYTNDQNNYQVVKNGDRLSRSDLRAGKYTKVYLVNMATQSFQNEAEYPSLDRGRDFLIDLSIDYKVVDPISLVQQGAGEIVTYIKKKLPYWLEEITADYSISDSKRVKKHIEDLHEHSSMVAGLKQVGIVISDINVLVKQSQRDQEHDKRFWKQDQDSELRIHEKEIKMREARFVAGEIQKEIEKGNLLNALFIAEDNKAALEVVQNRIQNEESFRLEVQHQVKKLMMDPSVDKVEVDQQIEKIKAYFPYEFSGGSNQTQTSRSTRMREEDPLDDLNDLYQSAKGE
ncbi:hypothetical protein CJ195_26900 [Bacillus sp. UMB0899]|nr:hypothetical protein CJ195_26900 [Bacillus sp. UMB0899]